MLFLVIERRRADRGLVARLPRVQLKTRGDRPGDLRTGKRKEREREREGNIPHKLADVTHISGSIRFCHFQSRRVCPSLCTSGIRDTPFCYPCRKT